VVLPDAVVEAVKRLAAEGRFSDAQMAAMTGVAKGSVQNIRTGRWDAWRKRREAAAGDKDETALALVRQHQEQTEKCASCGRRVVAPCLACEVVALLKSGALKPAPGVASPDDSLALQLRPADQARYREVRAAKIAREKLGGSDAAVEGRIRPVWFVAPEPPPEAAELRRGRRRAGPG
jgi:hypothetical protein